MRTVFMAIEEDMPGARWARLAANVWPGYRKWFLRAGEEARPSLGLCQQALWDHMPELVPTYRRLVDLMDGDEIFARALSLYCPTPYLSGCSQAIWGQPSSRLIRNYDYSPLLWEGLLLHSRWTGSGVVAMVDSLWGALDGMNESGLAVSLAFGGSRDIGEGFGIPLIVRYVLETCTRVAEATHTLSRVPSHMAYNVTVLDRAGEFATVQLVPNAAAVVTGNRVATNHQEVARWHRYVEASGSLDRERFLKERLEDPMETAARFRGRFFEPPLFSRKYRGGWGTLYTAEYDPTLGQAHYFWPPNRSITQSLTDFREQELVLRFESADAAEADGSQPSNRRRIP